MSIRSLAAAIPCFEQAGVSVETNVDRFEVVERDIAERQPFLFPAYFFLDTCGIIY